ncbi:biotin synthase BioB [Putridiphycobacter roseus]|uniref:Biotin synthase n=1 Tax=Putridiphycobacter roseus TaxID=2219161 RepID=A0A2W1N0U3_9FLAO|nr:biotin synthase BioB [Putridiphycobacter roseus]PZE17384.1 biotin synthase BioB [Putridiphycobacter roseus]
MVNKQYTSIDKLTDLYHSPMMDLLYKAATVHRENHNPNEVQMSSLISIKTGGCPEDCSYCPQSAKYNTHLEVKPMMQVEEVIGLAKNAKVNGSSRVCMGAAWREVRDNRDFDKVVEMVQEINGMGMEVCATLGMLNRSQADRLKNAGLYAYNHNLDSSPEFYKDIISTREYEQRIETIDHARSAGISVCSGGIIGMGESVEDRVGMLMTYVHMEQPPESLPINALVAVEGTPLEEQDPIPVWDMIRMIATARILFPKTIIRLSAGRTQMSHEAQTLCFFAGASSIFAGDKLLTTPNPDFNEDAALFELLGLTTKKPFQDGVQPETKADEKVAIAKKVRAEKEARKTESKNSKFEPRQISVG